MRLTALAACSLHPWQHVSRIDSTGNMQLTLTALAAHSPGSMQLVARQHADRIDSTGSKYLAVAALAACNSQWQP